MTDTPASVEARFLDQLMSLTPEERLAMACRMFSTAKALVRAGIPNKGSVTPGEFRGFLFLRLYGEDFNEDDRAKILARLRST